VSTIHLHLTVQQMPSGKHAATIRREDSTPFALTRAHDTAELANAWVLAQARDELSTDHDFGDAA
jgi:hypothetical protein